MAKSLSRGRWSAFRSAAATLAFVLGGPSIAAAQSLNPEPSFTGIGQAKDGDSLMVGGRDVRLFGIDSPELDQSCQRGGMAWACGRAAADQLRTLVDGRELRCTRQSIDSFGRSVARCSVGGNDLNAAMVESGFATAYRYYSSDYAAAENRAKAARRGLWAGTFEAPRDYRLDERAAQPGRASGSVPTSVVRSKNGRPRGGALAAAGRPSACAIKGNQNRRGQWIYHLPGMPYYAQTRAEQIFCTEDEARAAGYRRALVR